MGWLNNPPAKATHECLLPTIYGYNVGAQWKCDTCGAVWEIVLENSTKVLKKLRRGNK